MSVIQAYQSCSITILFKQFGQYIPLRNGILKTAFATTTTSSSSSSNKNDNTKQKTFNTRYPPKDPPENYNPSCVNHNGINAPEFIPAAVFRPFTSECETLGPGAHKEGCYKNSEYYSYHRFSFASLQQVCMQLRQQRQKEVGGKTCEEDKTSDKEKCDCDEK